MEDEVVHSTLNSDTEEATDVNTTDNGSKESIKKNRVGPDDFIVHGLLGKGSFGEVYLVEKKDTGVPYAMKVLHKSKIMSI